MRPAHARPRPAVMPDRIPAWGLALLDGQARILKLLQSRRDRALDGDVDVAIGRALAEHRLNDFRSCDELLAMASTDATLKAALDAALIENAYQLGKCFARLHRRGFINRTTKRGRRGWGWRVTV